MLNVIEVWEPEPPGTLWATPGLLWDCFTFLFLSPILALCWEECVVTCYYADGSSVIKCAEGILTEVSVVLEM